MARAPRLSQTVLAVELEQSLAVIDDATAGAGVDIAGRTGARHRAVALFDACGGAEATVGLVQVSYSAELLSLIAVDLAADPALARRLISALDKRAGVPVIALGREILSTGRLLEMPANMAIEVRISLMLAFLGARSVGLWMSRPSGELTAVSRAGGLDADCDQHLAAARRLLDGEESGGGDGTLGALIDRLRPPPAVLVATGVTAPARYGELLIGAASPVLSALLDRQALSTRDHAAQDTMIGSVERRLARLRFDLHDGPQQDVHLLAQDLSLFREQLRPMVAENANASRLLGRLDDLEAQLVALDGDLRRLSSAVASPFSAPGSLPEGLRTLTDAFASRTGIRPEVSVSGPLAQLSDSQQITLLALTREALSNIRKHAGARAVTVSVTSDGDGVHAEISDDGNGFDPEATLVSAARAGRLGLVGMHERVRMLGGQTRIDSRPGGPTVISATVPPWPKAEP